jgi:hypothetical protein
MVSPLRWTIDTTIHSTHSLGDLHQEITLVIAPISDMRRIGGMNGEGGRRRAVEKRSGSGIRIGTTKMNAVGQIKTSFAQRREITLKSASDWRKRVAGSTEEF